jgi:hypothetical protein
MKNTAIIALCFILSAGLLVLFIRAIASKVQ